MEEGIKRKLISLNYNIFNRKRIINEIGVKNILDNFKEYNTYNYSIFNRGFFLDLIYKYNYDELIDFIKNSDLDSNLDVFLDASISDYYFKLFINNLDNKNLLELYLNYGIFIQKKIIKYRKQDLITILDNINDPFELCNILNKSNDFVMSYLLNKIDINDINMFISYINDDTFDKITTLKENDFNKFFDSLISNYDNYDTLIKYLNKNNTKLVNYLNENINKVPFSTIYSLLENKDYNIINIKNNLVKNNLDYLVKLFLNNRNNIIIKEIIRNRNFPTNLKENILSKLDSNEIIEIFNGYLNSEFNFKDFYIGEFKTEFNIVIRTYLIQNRDLFEKCINHCYDKEFINFFIKIPFTDAELSKMLSSYSDILVNALFDNFNDRTKNILKEEFDKDNNLLIKYLGKRDNNKVGEYVLTLYDDERLLDFIRNRLSDYFYDSFFKLASNRLINILNNTKDQNVILLIYTKFNYQKEIFNLIINDNEDLVKLVFKDLNYDKRLKLFEKKPELTKKILLEEMKNDKSRFQYNFYTDNKSKYLDYVLSIIDDDTIEYMFNKRNGYTSYLIKNGSNVIDRYILNKVNLYLNNNDLDNFFELYEDVRTLSKNKIDIILNNLNTNLDTKFNIFINNKVYKEEKRNLLLLNPELLDYLKLKMKDHEFLKYNLLNKHMPEEIVDLAINELGNVELIELLYNPDFRKIDGVSDNFSTNLLLRTFNNSDITTKAKVILKKYSKDKFEFAKYFEDLINFLNIMDINEDNFFQYSLNSDYDYFKDFSLIYNDNTLVFKNIYNYFIKYIYTDNKLSYNTLFLITKNYLRYKDLCINILNNDEDLSNEDINNIKILFSRVETLDNKPINIDDCKNITSLLKNNYIDIIENNRDNILVIKNLIFNMLFNLDIDSIDKKLLIYGNSEELDKLIFNNRNNSNIIKLINNVKGYIEIIEDILNINDLNSLLEIAYKILDNYDEILNKFSIISLDELERNLYSNELTCNLTRIDSNNEELVIDKYLSKKYGVKVYDFSDKKYFVLAHVKSSKEPMEFLINGESNSNANFICLSAESYRKQNYYYNRTDDIIFGYDYLDPNSFICSSVSNMGSNSSIKSGSSDVKDMNYRKQRGILDLSNSSGNSEILAFREGLKPKYIIIPKNKDITLEHIDLCKKYGLTILITQPVDKYIDVPKVIDSREYNIDFNNIELDDIKDRLIRKKKSLYRKIAIITDIHSLYEPCLSVLHDIKKRGITEIYSLGDNIGTGPNPKEVLELLKKFNVKSLLGNHELYMLNGVEYYKEHLDDLAFEEAKLNSNWTRSKLDSDTIEEIRNYPVKKELIIGGKKILLCHYFNDYNTNKPIEDKSNFDLIIEGHVHFANRNDNLLTLSGMGIGSNKGEASYLIIEETDNGYNLETIEVPFDIENTINDINVERFNTKEKIKKWVK